MQRKPTALAILLGLCLSPVAFAQQSGQSDNPHQGAAASQQGSQQQGSQQAIPGGHPPVAIQTVVVAGTIDAIDREKRTVTLKGDDGQTVTIRAGDEVKDFDKLKKGQQIVARYTEAYALDMKKGDQSQQAQSSGTKQGSQNQASNSQANQSGQQSGGSSASGSQQAQSSGSKQGSQSQASNSQANQSGQQSGGPSASSSQQAQSGQQPVIGAVERLTVFGRVARIDQQGNRVIVQVPTGELIPLKVNDQQAMSDLKRGDAVAVTYVQASATELKPSSGSASDSAQRNESQQKSGDSQQQ